MLVSEFIEGYKNLHKTEAQVDFCRKHLRRTYAPIVEKNVILKRLVKACEMTNANGIKYIDMVCNKMNFTHAIITLYTDLELADPNAEESRTQVINNYDAFQELEIIDVFCDLIGEREVNELILINKNALDTWHEENSSTRAFVSDLTDKAVRTIVEMSALMKETITSEDQEKFSETLKSFIGIKE